MKINIPEKLNILASVCPFPLYVVGGFVRDSLAGLVSDSADVDICAPADADTFLKYAVKCGAEPAAVYRNTGTVKLKSGGEEYEYACFRSDEYVRGEHKPAKTFFTDDISLDARRRDFKCNAVYYNIKEETFSDPLGGMADIAAKRITTVADADKVFGEDGLRLMRLARQSAQTGFSPSADCIAGARHNCGLIRDVSAERVSAELMQILHADEKYGRGYAQYTGLKLLDEIKTLEIILPELTLGRGMSQNAAYHSHDVLEHSLRAVKYADKSVRLAALLHDAGKPYCMLKNGNYHGHESESARLAGDICSRLKMSKKTIAETVGLCALHMYDLKCDARESKVRKLMALNGGIIEKLLLLKQADYSACRDDLSEAPCVTKWRKILEKMKSEGAPFSVGDLDVRGDELIAAGVEPAKTGEILKKLLTDCAADPALNNKAALIKRAVRAYGNVKY